MIGSTWTGLPRPIRKFIVDAVEGAVVAITALTLVLPHTIPEATAQGLLILTTVIGPVISAARRDILPAVLEWWGSVKTSTE